MAFDFSCSLFNNDGQFPLLCHCCFFKLEEREIRQSELKPEGLERDRETVMVRVVYVLQLKLISWVRRYECC